MFETLLALAGLALALGLVAYARRAQANRTARRRAAFGIPTAVKEGE